MEKAKAPQAVNDMTLAKHIDVEILSQTESRSHIAITLLGDDATGQYFGAARPIFSSKPDRTGPHKLFRLSDASGRLSFDRVKAGERIDRRDLDCNDVFLVDIDYALWVWRGLGASESEGEREMWLTVA
jgi:gelsolin